MPSKQIRQIQGCMFKEHFTKRGSHAQNTLLSSNAGGAHTAGRIRPDGCAHPGIDALKNGLLPAGIFCMAVEQRVLPRRQALPSAQTTHLGAYLRQDPAARKQRLPLMFTAAAPKDAPAVK
jgi:hypothetical protein